MTDPSSAPPARIFLVVSLLSATGCGPEWRAFSPPGGELTVAMPGVPAEASHEASRGLFTSHGSYVAIPYVDATTFGAPPSLGRTAKVLWSRLRSRASDRESTYLAGFGELREPDASDDDVLSRYRDGIFAPADDDRGSNVAWSCSRSALTETELRLDEHAGMEIVFEERCADDGGAFTNVWLYRTRFFRVGARVFVLEVMTVRDHEDETAADAQRFFDSFELP